MIDKETNIINELAVLYELSLSTGTSLDLGQNCASFIDTLVNKKNIDYGAVYLNASIFNVEAEEYLKFYSIPQNNLDADSIPISKVPSLNIGEIICCNEIDCGEAEKGLGRGSYAAISLGETGFIKLYSSETNDLKFNETNLNPLTGVVRKFHTSLQGSLAHSLLESEISHRKDSESKLRARNEELKKLNVQLDRFVYSASHDLRAPLASILGLINLIERSDSKEDRSISIELLKSNIMKLDGFIHDIIEITRSSRVEVKHETIDVYELVSGVFNNLKFLKGNKNIQECIELSGDRQLVSDKHRLEIVLNNIIGNALKYSNPDSSESYIQVVIDNQPNAVAFKIKDNGIGIDPFHVEKIFDMFYRATDINAGSGLGLYITKENIERLKGTITIRSEIGEGTEVNIKIPLS